MDLKDKNERIIDLREVGATGLRRFSGFVFEEFLNQLLQWKGAAIYKEMSWNDATINACLYAVENLIRKVQWGVKPASSQPYDMEAADFLDSCRLDMSVTWADLINEVVHETMVYGYCVQELVYKRRCGDVFDPSMRSKHRDGRVGWRKMSVRSTDTIYRWQFDDHGGIQGVEQLAPPHYYHVTIPIEKLLLFRTRIMKNNPEGRAQPLDTLIVTPNGWTTIGEIQVGDELFDESGAVTKVVAKSDIFQNRPCYKVTFSTGHSIIADGNHLWSVTTHNDRFNNKNSRCLSTEEMFTMQQRADQNFSCGRAPKLQCSEQDLLIDPYILGYWLGNGTTTAASLSCSEEDAEFISAQINAAGYRNKIHIPDETKARKIFVRDEFISELRELQVLGNKYIPLLYLRSSQDQRLALLQGLMDSDGHSPSGGNDTASVFHNTNVTLIHQFAELVRTLGGRPYVKLRQKAGRSGGCISGKTIVSKQDLYEVRFHLDLPIHRLPRKLANQTIKSSSRTTEHFIESIIRVENTDTQCIQIESVSHLYLSGEGMVPTHNSLLRGCYRDWYMKKNIENIEAIGIERDLAGLPVALVPPELLSSNASSVEKQNLAAIKEIVTNIRRDEQEGIIFPKLLDANGKDTYELKLLSTGGQRQFDTDKIIHRYDMRIARTFLADFLMIGQEKVGTSSMVGTRQNLFGTAISGFLDIVSDIFNNYAVPRLFALNDFQMTDYPTITHGDIGAIDLKELAAYITALANAGMPLFPDTQLENYLLKAGGMPERPDLAADRDLDVAPEPEKPEKEIEIPAVPLQTPTGLRWNEDTTPVNAKPPVSQVVTNESGNVEITSRGFNAQNGNQFYDPMLGPQR